MMKHASAAGVALGLLALSVAGAPARGDEGGADAQAEGRTGTAGAAGGADAAPAPEERGSELPSVAALPGARPPIYVPRSRGANERRAPAATRGPADITLLAPRHVGLTQHAQPLLYWSLDREADAEVELVLSARDADAPLLAITLARPVMAGIHAVSLEKHDVRLEPGVVYDWSATLSPDPQRPWKDRVSYAALERVALDTGIAREAARPARGESAYHVYARSGLWFDAIDDLSQRIARSPADTELRAARAALLDQVGLTGPAGWDRSSVMPTP